MVQSKQLVWSLALLLFACSSEEDANGNPDKTGGSSGSGGSATNAGSGGSNASGTGNDAGTGTDAGRGGAGKAGSSNTAGTGGKSGGGDGGKAGSSSSAGNNNAGGPAHVVRGCTDDSDQPAEVGVWEDITPEPLRGKQYAGGTPLVHPADPAIVYISSGDGGGLFKSTDCGATWVHVNTGVNGDQMDRGRLWSMVMDPIEPDTIYSVNGYGALSLWKTTNGGVDWTDLFPPGSEVANTAVGNFASIVAMDPTDHLHLVVAFHNGCQGDWGPNCQAETLDGGDNWRLLKAPTSGEGSGVVIINKTTWVAGAFEGLYRTGDSGETWDLVINATAPHYQMYTSPDGRYFIGTQSGVITSSGDGAEWELLPNSGDKLMGITGSATRMWASQQFGGKYFTAPVDDPVNWEQLPERADTQWGAYLMAYDPDHHILYGSEMGDGFWRMVTE